MAIPDFVKFASATESDDVAKLQSTSRSRIYRSRNTTGQAYIFDVDTVPVSPTEGKKISGWLSGINRANSVIETALPVISNSNADRIEVNGGALTRGQYFCTVSTTEDIEVGDFFKFENHTKAYKVTAIDNFGNIEFSPNLVEAVPDLTGMLFDGVEFSFKISNSAPIETPYSNDQTVSFNLELHEVW